MKRKICPCCGYYTVESDDEVIVDICDVCFWQYDVVATVSIVIAACSVGRQVSLPFSSLAVSTQAKIGRASCRERV